MTKRQTRQYEMFVRISTFAAAHRTSSPFEQGIRGRSAGKTTASGAESSIRAALARGMEAARDLDVIVANTLGPDTLTAEAIAETDLAISAGASRETVRAPDRSWRARPPAPGQRFFECGAYRSTAHGP